MEKTKPDEEALSEIYESKVKPKESEPYTGAEQAAETEREISRLEKELKR